MIAAVYLDGGMDSAVRLVRTWLLDETMEAVVEAARAGEVGDYKSMLQEYLQAHGLGQPRYQLTSETGPDHRKSFVVEVKFLDPTAVETTLASATGTRKKHAEQEAARLALQHLRSLQATEPAALTEDLAAEKQVREKNVAGKEEMTGETEPSLVTAPAEQPPVPPAPAPVKIQHHHEVLILIQTTLTFLVSALFVLDVYRATLSDSLWVDGRNVC